MNYRGIISYEYTDVEDGRSQYDDVDIENTIGVEARYVDTGSDRGNMYIEALPKPKSGEWLRNKCLYPLYGYTSRENEIMKPVIEQLLMISKLRDVRFQLPINIELETECYMALVNSYRRRKPMYDRDIRLSYVAHNGNQSVNMILSGENSDAANAGFSVVGYSGCGKSSALKTLFKSYPQFIIHKGEGMTIYPQIVYLVVQCPPHSNFRGLFRNIGVAIDKALGNLRPVYAEELDSGARGNLSLYKDKVRELIEKFGIGLIVFDEIQHINFTSGVENSFETLLELVNETKVAFAVVGTEDAKAKLFNSSLRQVRRSGGEIHADIYCSNDRIFSYFVKELLKYQWFGCDIRLDKEKEKSITEALYDCSKGIIDQLVGLYMYMNIDYVRASERNKPEVNADYVYRTSERHFPGIRAILDRKIRTFDKERMEINSKAYDELREIIDEERSRKALDSVMETANCDGKIDSIRNNVVQNILRCEMFSEEQISGKVSIVISSDEGKKLILKNDEKGLTQKTMELLIGKSAKKKDRKRTFPNSSSLADYVFKSECSPDDGVL